MTLSKQWILLVLLLLCSCVPYTSNLVSKREIPRGPIVIEKIFSNSFEKVWGASVRTFAETDFEQEIMDSTSGIIKAKTSYVVGHSGTKAVRQGEWPRKNQISSGYSDYLSQYADIRNVRVMQFATENLTIYVNKETDTLVKVVVKYEPQAFDYIDGLKQCYSNGEMERKILGLISKNIM